MTFAEVVRNIGGELVVRTGSADREVRHVVASDLMSDVLIVDEDDMLLITSLASDQVLRTAQIVGATGVVIMNGKPLSSPMAGIWGCRWRPAGSRSMTVASPCTARCTGSGPRIRPAEGTRQARWPKSPL